MHETLARMNVNPGAETFIASMNKSGAQCILVSGGFTFFTGAVAEKVGFHGHHGNTLVIENGALTGGVGEPILDKDSKLTYLKHYAEKLGISLEETLTIGDGANDLPMLKAAGLGIGYYPKPSVAAELDNLILYGDFTAALYAQGLRLPEP
ncbi:MAG: HAD-IB family phosphatase [Alphaproteobacteria bacterium]|nr:HAD-IB family phosphatase [Alphaproteobacteria bacterium]